MYVFVQKRDNSSVLTLEFCLLGLNEESKLIESHNKGLYDKEPLTA